MPAKAKITKEMTADTAFAVAREAQAENPVQGMKGKENEA